MHIICFGDSITHAAGFPEGDRWPTILQHAFEARAPGVHKVFNRGIGGHTTYHGMDRIANDVLALLPGIVLIEFGFNDASVRAGTDVPKVAVPEFTKNLRTFHRLISAKGGQCVFVINHTIRQRKEKQDNGRTYTANFRPYNPAIRAVAQTVGAPCIDLPALMTARGIDLAAFLSSDGLHLSAVGNHRYAEMILAGLEDIVLADFRSIVRQSTN